MIKPGDKVRINSASSYEDCEGTVTYSLDKFGRPVILITNDPTGLGDVGKRKGIKPEALERIIEVSIDPTEVVSIPKSDLHNVIDILLPFV